MGPSFRVPSFRIAILAITLNAFVGCNIFSIVDPPSGDRQTLEAARGCFDRSDYVCATRYYSQLSSAASDTGNSEAAFELLAQSGMTAAVFMNAVLGGLSNGAGGLITQLANALVSTAGETTRLNMFHAYQKSLLIVDTRTQGLVKLITTLSLLSELLAEAATGGSLHKSDLVLDATACAAGTVVTAALGTDCTKPTGSVLTSGYAALSASDLTSATDTQMSGGPTLRMIYITINELLASTSQVGSSSLGSSTSSFAGNFSSLGAALQDDPNDNGAFRWQLITLSVGS